ncbi:NACHT domain-containing protein [Streptomyces sp. NPDC093225]|uniref:NACHT domain-containing protein n=1 Tax=Streptomyces sp. NPDC093225 TaxID=3366034 RepID=UPI0038165971
MDPVAQAGLRLASTVIGPIVKKLFRMSEGPGAGLVDRPARISSYVSWREKRAPDRADLDRVAAELVEAALNAPGERALPPGEEAGVAAALAATLYGLADLDLTDAEAVELGHLALARALRARTPPVGLSEQAAYLHDRVLETACLHVLHFLTQRSAFVAATLVHQSRRQAELVAKVDELVARIPRQDARDTAFERRYLDYVVRKHSTLTIFGIDLTRTPGKWPLDAAYMSLEATAHPTAPRGAVTDADGRVWALFDTPGPRPADQALADRPRVLLRGEAGSGKTTLIQWLAVSAARPVPDGRMAYLHDKIPFVLPLRTLTRQHVHLPAPREFLTAVGVPLAGEQPPGWEDRVLTQGRGLVLVDGLDEIPEGARRRVREWLVDLAGLYPGNRWLLTCRPSAVIEDWLREESFTELALSPMGHADVATFLGRWHAAARTGGEEEDAALAEYESQLLHSVRANVDLGRLATNPLMCGLICALHRDRRGFLPLGRKDLYSAALSMLLSRRDRERSLEVPQVSEETQLQLLQRLAYWLIRNNASEMDRSRAEALVQDALPALPEAAALGDGREVFAHLLLRSGLLRTPAPGRVDFVHRTFQDFLGARAVVDEGSFGELAAHADDDQWDDVIRMAVAQARPRERTEILRGLLARSASTRATLLAYASLPHAPEVDPEVRDAVTLRAQELIPPAGPSEALDLSSVGPMLLGLLPDPEDLDEWTAYYTFVAATGAAAGSPTALPYLARFAGHSWSMVQIELFRHWAEFGTREYGEEVIARMSPTSLALVTTDEQLDVLADVRPARWLQCNGSVTPAALARYAARVPLTRLFVFGNPLLEDLEFLRGRAHGLTNVTFDTCPQLDDLSALTDIGIQNARLSLNQRRTALPVLRSWSALKSVTVQDGPIDIAAQLGPGVSLHSLAMERTIWHPDRPLGLHHHPQLTSLALDSGAAPRDARGWAEITPLQHLATLQLPAPSLACARPWVVLPGVKNLTLPGSRELTKALIKRIPELFPQLAALHVPPTQGDFNFGRLLPQGITVIRV